MGFKRARKCSGMLLQKLQEHSPDILRLRGSTAGLHDVTHDLVNHVGVALPYCFCLLRECSDRFLAPFFK